MVMASPRPVLAFAWDDVVDLDLAEEPLTPFALVCDTPCFRRGLGLRPPMVRCVFAVTLSGAPLEATPRQLRTTPSAPLVVEKKGAEGSYHHDAA